MTGKSLIARRSKSWRLARVACAIVLAVAMLDPSSSGQAASSALSLAWAIIKRAPFTQAATQGEGARVPTRRQVPRIKLLVKHTHELDFDEAIVAVTVLDPNVATARAVGERHLVIEGLSAGETVLIISGSSKRETLVIQVVRPPRPARTEATGPGRQTAAYSGFYGVHFSPGSDGVPSLLKHDFAFNQKLSGSRTLRASGEVYNFFGRGERGLAQSLGAGFGMNRVELGLDSPQSSFDLLDSELNVSRLGFHNYTVRGPHLVLKSDSRWKGLEIFAGRARPQISLFNEGEGLLAGGLVPVAQSESWRLRVGAFFISPRGEQGGPDGGMVWHTDARYAPDEKTTAEAEIAYARGRVSWRAHLDLRRGPFNVNGEFFRLDPQSPLVGIGAQSGGHKANSLSLQWRPDPRFAASLSYHATAHTPLSTARRVELNGRTLTATASFVPARGARLRFGFNQQELETPPCACAPVSPQPAHAHGLRPIWPAPRPSLDK
jgi:hypothetical protein